MSHHKNHSSHPYSPDNDPGRSPDNDPGRSPDNGSRQKDLADENARLNERLATLEQAVAQMSGRRVVRLGRRLRSQGTFLGIPWWEIATGPDLSRNELRGHARAIFAIGDIATGVVAIGGIARGGLCLGGLSLGVIGLGGCSMGLLLAAGGLAVGGIALGGCAIGGIALGGFAVGYFACGGSAIGHYAIGAKAIGNHVITVGRQDPQALQLLQDWFPWVQVPQFNQPPKMNRPMRKLL